MHAHRELTVRDYLAMLKRRLWWILVPTLLAPCIAVLVSLKLPEKFTSQTLVLVEQQKVPDNFVKPVVSEDLNGRLASMKEQILSRTRLQPIIERFGLYSDEKVPMEEKIERMRKSITVTPIRSETAKTTGMPGFFISFTANHPRIAQQVCSEITSMFLSENLRAREQSAQGTTDFLKSQLEDAKRSLDEQDAKLAAFQRKYIGQLPGQEQTSFNMLTTLNTQLEAIIQALSRLQQDKTYAEAMLATQLSTWQSSQTVASPEQSEKLLQQMQVQLASLEARYTSDHPDVRKLKSDIEAFKQQVAHSPEAKSAPAPTGVEPQQIQQLRAGLKSIDQAIKDKRNEQDRVQQQIQMYQARLQLSPMVQEEFKKLTRDYQTALQFYNDLLAKKNQSEMATDLERKQQGEQFRVVDPPNLPEKPTFPDRIMFALGGLGGGLALGAGLAFFLEWHNQSIWTERDVLAYMNLPTLAAVPVIAVASANKTIQRRRLGGFRARAAQPKPEQAGA